MLCRGFTHRLVACLGACNTRELEPFVVLIGVDGASLDIVTLPELHGSFPLRLVARWRSHRPAGE